MTSKKLGSGDPIEARCTKCRKITNHTIVAMKDELPAKVECNTCHGQHLYCKPKTMPQTAAQKASNAKLAEQKKWTKLQLETEGVKARPYNMEESYRDDSLIKHPQFGFGHVQRNLGNRKIEVLFSDGLKTMRCK